MKCRFLFLLLLCSTFLVLPFYAKAEPPKSGRVALYQLETENFTGEIKVWNREEGKFRFDVPKLAEIVIVNNKFIHKINVKTKTYYRIMYLGWPSLLKIIQMSTEPPKAGTERFLNYECDVYGSSDDNKFLFLKGTEVLVRAKQKKLNISATYLSQEPVDESLLNVGSVYREVNKEEELGFTASDNELIDVFVYGMMLTAPTVGNTNN